MEKKKKSIFKRWWFWVLIVLVIGIGAGSCGGDSKESENQKAVADDTEADQPAGKAKEESDTGAKETGKSDEATVDEQTLMDQNGISSGLQEIPRFRRSRSSDHRAGHRRDFHYKKAVSAQRNIFYRSGYMGYITYPPPPSSAR